MVKAIESKEEFDSLINSGSVVVVDFWATWCGPCKLISPHFGKLEAKFPNVKFVKVDVEEQEEVAKEQAIRSMPTFRVFKDGKQIDEIIGAVPAKLTALVEKANSAAGEAAPAA